MQAALVAAVVMFGVTVAAYAELPRAQKQLDIADRYFRTAEHAAPESPLRAHSYELAEKLAIAVLEMEPDNAAAHFLVFAARGRRILAERGRPSVTNFWKYTDLNAHLARAIELDPTHAEALAAKGGILLDLPGFLGGDRRQARALLERALVLNPTGLGTRMTLARALLLEGDVQAARRHLLLAAHYACVKREFPALQRAEQMLAELAADPL